MSYCHFMFDTTGFTDSAEIRAQNVNGIVGHTLATWLAGELNTRGISVPEVWDEDHGWDFFASDASTEYLCACSVIVEDGTAPNEGHVTLSKRRSFADMLLLRNKYSSQDAIVVAISEILKASPEIRNITAEY